jgi:hypothetical protein
MCLFLPSSQNYIIFDEEDIGGVEMSDVDLDKTNHRK